MKKMLSKITSLLLCGMMVLGMTSCSDDESSIEVQKVQFAVKEFSLSKKETKQLEVSVLPENATNKIVTWSSSDEGVATVDENGLVTAIKSGECKIVATASNGVSSECKLGVFDGAMVLFEIYSVDMKMGEKIPFNYTVLPETYKGEVKWESSDPSVAAFHKGELFAFYEGTTVISGILDNGSKALCTVHVSFSGKPVEEFYFDFTPESLFIGHNKFIQRRFVPEDASDQRLKWSSSDESVAPVSGDGLVMPKKVGTVTITAVCHNGISASCSITIKDPNALEGFMISPFMTVAPRERSWDHCNPSVLVFKEQDAEKYKELEWEIDDTSVIDFERDDSTGEINKSYFGYPIVVVAEGASTGQQTTLTATSKNGEKSSCVMTVNLESGYKFATTVMGVREHACKVGETVEIFMNISPVSATDKSVVLFSSDEEVVQTFNGEVGKVKGVKAGVATVYCFSKDSGQFDSTVVTVSDN